MFTREAKIYDKFYKNKDYKGEVEEISRFLSGNSIVDIGCGTGRHDEEFAKKGFRVMGIEPCKEMADIAHSRGLSVKSDFNTGEMFDNAVVLFDVFNFFDNPSVEVIKIASIVKKDGTLVFDAWDPKDKTKTFVISKRNGMVRVAYKRRKGNTVYVHFFYMPSFVYSKHVLKLYTDDEIKKIVEESGFMYKGKTGRWWQFKKI